MIKNILTFLYLPHIITRFSHNWTIYAIRNSSGKSIAILVENVTVKNTLLIARDMTEVFTRIEPNEVE